MEIMEMFVEDTIYQDSTSSFSLADIFPIFRTFLQNNNFDTRKINRRGLEKGLNRFFGKCNSKSLNAGTYIGIVKDLIVILQQIYNLYPIDNADDQILLTKYCNKYNNYIYVDVNNELFLTLQKAYSEIDTHLTFKDNTISYNNNRPFFIHGPGETYLDNIIKKIDYDYYKKNKKVSIALKNDYYKKILLRINSSELLTNIISFIFIIAFLYLFYYHLRFLF